MATPSAEAAGLENYVVKRDWRRDSAPDGSLGAEVRAEGHLGLVLNPDLPVDFQVTPPGSSTPITLIAEARRGDDLRVLIAGNPTTLWACTTTEDTHYVLNDQGQPDYFESGSYVDETQYGWVKIADGMAASARRWEAVPLGDYLVLNNGVDLPMTYRPGDLEAVPIYELREQQIAAVGTVAAHGSNLAVMDLWQINDVDFLALMEPTPGAVDASQDPLGVVSVKADLLFPGKSVAPGLRLFWESGQQATILSVGSDGTITSTVTPPETIRTIAPKSLSFNSHTGGFDFSPLIPGEAYLWVAGQSEADRGGHTKPLLMLGTSAYVPSGTAFISDGSSVRAFAIPPDYPDYDGTLTQIESPYAIPPGKVSLENPAAYARFTDTTKMQRFPWRFLPSMQGSPRRWGATVPVSANLGDRLLKFQYPIRSLPELARLNNASGKVSGLVGGQLNITVLFAGAGGVSLPTSVIGIGDEIAMSCRIADPVLNPIVQTGDQASSLESSDAVGSYAGSFVDLVDDGGAIIKALQLRDQIVVYKETPFIYLGSYTGDNTEPYRFQKVKIANEGQSLFYRNTVIAAGGGFYGSCHVYCGRNDFYKFDLFTQTPQVVPELQAAADEFFRSAPGDPENAFVAENPLTREWVWGWKGNADDRALCLDYVFKTCRTTSAAITAAGKLQHPNRGDWLFVFGSDNGSVQRYGLLEDKVFKTDIITVSFSNPGYATTSAAVFSSRDIGKTIMLDDGQAASIASYVSPTKVGIFGDPPEVAGPAAFRILPGMWHRNGQPYLSTLETGLGDLGTSDSEKLVTAYSAVPSSRSPNSTITATFKSATNPSRGRFVQEFTMVSPGDLSTIEPTFTGYYVGVKLSVDGINNPFELVCQGWHHKILKSMGIGNVAPLIKGGKAGLIRKPPSRGTVKPIKFFVNNGFDPVAGPPFLPSVYQLFGGGNQNSTAHLHWDIPPLDYVYNLFTVLRPDGTTQQQHPAGSPRNISALWVSTSPDPATAVEKPWNVFKAPTAAIPIFHIDPNAWLSPNTQYYVWATQLPGHAHPPTTPGTPVPPGFVGLITGEWQGSNYPDPVDRGPTITFTPWNQTVFNASAALYTVERSPSGTVGDQNGNGTLNADDPGYAVVATNLPGSATPFDDTVVIGSGMYYRVTGYALITGPSARGYVLPYNVVYVTPNPSGTSLSVLNVGGPTVSDTAIARSIAFDASGSTILAGVVRGNVTIGGQSLSNVSGSQAVFLVKIGTNGLAAWPPINLHDSAGGPQVPGKVLVDGNGDIFVCGSFQAFISINGVQVAGSSAGQGTTFGYDSFVIKYSGATGAHLWHSVFTTTPGGLNNQALGMTLDSIGNPIVVGYYNGTINIGGTIKTPIGTTNTYVAKLDAATGSTIWVKTFGSAGNYCRAAAAVVIPSTNLVPGHGNIVVTGFFGGFTDFGQGKTATSVSSQDLYILAVDASGSSQWLNTYGTVNVFCYPYDAAVAPNGDFAIAGSFAGGNLSVGGPVYNAPDTAAILVAKYDSAGNHKWSRAFGGWAFSVDNAFGVAMDGSGNVFIGGTVRDGIDMGGGFLTFSPITVDPFLAKYASADGAWQWAKRFPSGIDGIGTDFDTGYCVAINPTNGRVTLGGSFTGRITFYANVGLVTAATGGNANLYAVAFQP